MKSTKYISFCLVKAAATQTPINRFLVVFGSSRTVDLGSILIGNEEDIVTVWDRTAISNSGDPPYLGIEARRDRNWKPVRSI
jgi:hypothetical protein